jgi:protocatechuate 3,4-dioxygenase, alpha subunit
MSLRTSASQTVGPFFELGLSWLYVRELGTEAASGERVQVRGRVYDGAGKPVPDAVLEIWQADAHGRYPNDPDGVIASPPAEFSGFGRVPTDATGTFSFRTIKPGRVPGPAGKLQAPHLSLQIFMRGLLKPVHTRLYFPGDPANAEDPVLALVPEARRASLIAKQDKPAQLTWDVRLQGQDETVFFQY